MIDDIGHIENTEEIKSDDQEGETLIDNFW